ncbi:MAG TPA: DUF5009 domain-containing protein [Ignavibacteriaceae bacterium]|nr:DUF5009 domain-containing protein [Ignavibacteriaceae bacterium]
MELLKPKEKHHNKIINKKEPALRALALDALRGIAILGMILSSRIPSTLPSWMFHAQNPPPTHSFHPEIPGITWVDLVFPFFLFAMGAAIPLALKPKLESNKITNVLLDIVKRTVMLVFFAIVIEHIMPGVMVKDPTFYTYIISLLCFLCLFLSYVKLPSHLKLKNYERIFRIIGFTGLIIFLVWITYPDGSGFRVQRSDIIILVLANVFFFGSLLWLATQNNFLIRLSIFGVLLAFRLTHTLEGNWLAWAWNNFQIPWLFKIYYLQYLFIVIPGTIAGDIILKWINNAGKEDTLNSFLNNSSLKIKNIFLTSFIFISIIIIVSGLYSRQVFPTTLYAFAFCLIGWLLIYKDKSVNEKFIKSLFGWGTIWLIIGIMLDPYEGGIQKGRPTLSFYFVTSGIALMFLVSFTIIIHFFNKHNYLDLVIKTGQNPLLAYAGGTNLITPLLAITMIDGLLQSLAITPWLGFVKGLFVTLLLLYLVKVLTNNKIFLRA